MLRNRLWATVAAVLVVGAGLPAATSAAAVPTAPPGTVAPAADTAIAPALPPGGSFVPVAPRRVLDTRGSGGPVLAASIPVATALPGVADVAAVLLNVTVVGAAGNGYVVVGAAQGTSNGNFVATAPSATLALARPQGGAVPLSLSVRGHLVVDVQGYVTTAAGATSASFTPLAAPRRAADTRRGVGLSPFTAGRTQVLDVAGRSGLPTAATAVVANVTVASASASTYVTAWSGVGARPVVSSVNAGRGQIVANRALLPLDASGRAAFYNSGGRTDVVVDVIGYLSPDPGGSYYVPVDASRLLDSRTRAATVRPTVDAGNGTAVLAPSVADLAPTTAVWLTVVGDQPAGRGYVTTRPGDTAPTGTSDLNLVPGRAVANAGPVRVSGADGSVDVTSSADTRVVVDLAGWFVRAPATAAAGLWSGTRYPDYTDSPTRRDTLPTTLPPYFAGGVFLGQGTRTETRAFAVAPDGTVHQSSHRTAEPAAVLDWTTPSRVGPTGPTQDGYLAGVTGLASAGDRQTAAVYAVTALGAVYAFQSNADGELAEPPSDFVTYPLRPSRIPLPTPVATAVYAAQGVGYAVGLDGTLYSWGRADTGQLGRTPTATPWLPAAVDGLTRPRAVAGDDDVTFGVDAEGATYVWGHPVGGTTVATPTPFAAACADATALHADVNGVWELCSDGTVVRLDRLGAVPATTTTLPVAGVTAVAAGPGYDNGVRVLLADGRVAVVPSTGPARYEAGFAGVTAVNGAPGVEITAVGG